MNDSDNEDNIAKGVSGAWGLVGQAYSSGTGHGGAIFWTLINNTKNKYSGMPSGEWRRRFYTRARKWRTKDKTCRIS